MPKRYAAIWFRYLVADRMIRQKPELKQIPFAVAAPERGRMVVKAMNKTAQERGVDIGKVVADCRAIIPSLMVFDEKEGMQQKLLHALAEWCIRFTPVVGVDMPDGLLMDVSGCAHLWDGEEKYLKCILGRFEGFGYDVQVAIADTIGAAWAACRYGQKLNIVPCGRQVEALLKMPPAALRLEADIISKLGKLGLHDIGSFLKIPRRSLSRRFGTALLRRLDQAFGQELEAIEPVCPIEPYIERLPCLDPIRTATGIEIALKTLLEQLCKRLNTEGKGLRVCVFKGYRIDGDMQKIDIGTGRPSRNTKHLFRLFEDKISSFEPKLGIELFTLEATVVEELPEKQEAMWSVSAANNNTILAELLDRIAGKVGVHTIHRYLPDEHYWPERSVRKATSLDEMPATQWRTDLPRPVHLLARPEPIEVTVPIPDYPPMLFHYKGKLHNVTKADGPERIEQEWWIANGLYRDYYCVEDNEGARYWLFRLGHYNSGEPKWFIHGFFA